MQSHLGALTVLLLALFFSSTQKVWGQKFSLGLKAGPSVTFGRFRDTDLRNTYSVSPKVGFTAGGLIIFPLKKNIHSSPNLLIRKRERSYYSMITPGQITQPLSLLICRWHCASRMSLD